MCAFITRTRDSVVRAVSVHDVLQGNVRLPFTSRPAWLAVQSECPDLRRTHAHLAQGTRPSKKLTNIKDVKRYSQVASIADDGLLVVQRHDPLSPTRECIIVPRQALDGLLTALHIQLLVERKGGFRSFVLDSLFVENGKDIYLHGENNSTLFGSENFSAPAFFLLLNGAV